MLTVMETNRDNREMGELIRRHRSILIVDDNESVLDALEHHLKESKFIVHKASNGKEALHLSSGNPVDIIVSDIGMPEMDGLELCESIRQDPMYFDIPFIFLTAHGGENDRIEGFRSGADEYIVKPFRMEELVARIEILCDRVERKRSLLTLAGNLKDVALYEVLQFFELTRKKGVLHIDNSQGTGDISFSDGTIMDASWNKLEGEDALLEMFSFKEGAFRFEPKDVLTGNIVKPLSYILMETARLMDELLSFEEYVPEPGVALTLGPAPAGEVDAESKQVFQALKHGCSSIKEIRDHLNISDARLKLAVSKLIKKGSVLEARGKIVEGQPLAASEKPGIKPHKILVAFTDEETLLRCFAVLSVHERTSKIKSGFSDFCQITLSSQVYSIFFLRGEKRFSFMWEPILKTSEGALFILNSKKDKEHADFFSNNAAALGKPFLAVSFNSDLSGQGTRTIGTSEEMIEVILDLNKAVGQR